MREHTSDLTITLSPQERRILAQYQRSTTLPAGLVRRARCVLLRARGHSLTAIADLVGLSRPHVTKWLKQFQSLGLAGLNDQQGRRARTRDDHHEARED